MLNKIKLNGLLKKQQILRFAGVGLGGVLLLALILIASKGGHKPRHVDKPLDFTGAMDAQFSEADTESAMTSQQLELDSLKKQMATLVDGIKNLQKQNEEQTAKLTQTMTQELARVKIDAELKSAEHTTNQPVLASNSVLQTNPTATDAYYPMPGQMARLNKPQRINSVSFQSKRLKTRNHFKNPMNYVPSGTFAKAVVLGGVDADASVDAQNQNHGVMLFKIINPGTLPNGKHSHLTGCFVTGSAYGDISSERAYVKLTKLSCVYDNSPIIDKAVTGWAFFGGKVGIKGIPLMRDGKVVTWAGISGGLAGVAQAAQYAQSVQNFGAYGGATSIVPSSNIGPFAALGGASKAADTLSQYYIKRAEQYHPVIQVGSGNLVDIVFQDGFFLQDEPEQNPAQRHHEQAENKDPLVPDEVLSQINQAQLGQELASSGASQ